MNKYAERIKQGITPQLVEDIIADNRADHDRMRKLHSRYKADESGVPILERRPIQYDPFESEAIKRLDDKVNNRLNNPFDADIVDTKIGYFLGHPISYEYSAKVKEIEDRIAMFNLRSNIDDADSELGKMASICGKSARLAYVDLEGKERIMNIDPWQVSYIGSDIHEPDYAVRHYKDAEDKKHVEFYDNEEIHYFKEESVGKLVFDRKQKHSFDFVPLMGLENNKEQLGDAERVDRLIDAYDRTLSDASNEIEQYRLAYLVAKGAGIDPEDLKNMKKSGLVELYGENDDLRYLTKDINDDLIEHHLDRLERNIIKLSKSVDFGDETFQTALSGVAMKFKLMALENKCITMERKFTSMLRYQYKVIFSAWRKKTTLGDEDYLKVWFGFKRNLPVNVLEEAQASQALKGLVSEDTRLSLFSFVDDIQFEKDGMAKDQDEMMSAYESVGGANENPEGD